MCPFCHILGKGKYPPLPHQPQGPLPLSKWKKECGVADFDGLLPRSSGGGEGLRVEGGGESALGMAKEIDSTLHCRFTTFTASWKYSKWSKPSGANPTTVAGTRIPLERV